MAQTKINRDSVKRQQLFILLGGNLINVFAYSLFGPLFSLYVLHLGGTPWQVSKALALYAFVLGACLLIFGRWQNTIANKQAIVMSGFFLLSMGAFAYLFVRSVPEAYVVQAWNAASVAWMTPAFKALYASMQKRGHETEAWAWMDGSNQLLVAGGILGGGFVLTWLGFHSLIIAVGTLQLIGALFSLQLLHFSPRT